MRKVTQPLNPSQAHGHTAWEGQLSILYSRLELAINYYSGLAQPPHSPDEKIAKAVKKSDDRMRQEIVDVVADIACALGVSVEALADSLKKRAT